jgi:isopenicillin-N epimerase
LDALGADFYTGNCHKWMLAPKGAAFLYARPEVQHLVQPLVVSWGYHPTPAASSGCQFVDYLSWSGTKDPAAALTVPAAIDFMHLHDWVNVRQTCHVRLRQVLQGVSDLFGLPTLYPLDSDLYGQMGAAQLPNHTNIAQVKTALIDRFGVEVPLVAWNDKKLVRISVQIYNTDEDVQALLTGLKQLLT